MRFIVGFILGFIYNSVFQRLSEISVQNRLNFIFVDFKKSVSIRFQNAHIFQHNGFTNVDKKYLGTFSVKTEAIMVLRYKGKKGIMKMSF